MHKLIRLAMGALVTTGMVLGVVYLMNRTAFGSRIWTAVQG
jgi:hypothetical protein